MPETDEFTTTCLSQVGHMTLSASLAPVSFMENAVKDETNSIFYCFKLLWARCWSTLEQNTKDKFLLQGPSLPRLGAVYLIWLIFLFE